MLKISKTADRRAKGMKIWNSASYGLDMQPTFYICLVLNWWFGSFSAFCKMFSRCKGNFLKSRIYMEAFWSSNFMESMVIRGGGGTNYYFLCWSAKYAISRPNHLTSVAICQEPYNLFHLAKGQAESQGPCTSCYLYGHAPGLRFVWIDSHWGLNLGWREGDFAF